MFELKQFQGYISSFTAYFFHVHYAFTSIIHLVKSSNDTYVNESKNDFEQIFSSVLIKL